MSNTLLRKNLFCLLAIIIVSVLSMPANVFAADKGRAPDEQRPRQQKGGHQQRFEEMIERIAQNDPKKADQLRKLRDEDPEEFRKQMHQHRQEVFGQMHPEQDRRGQRKGSERFDGERGRGGQGRGREPERGKMDDDRRGKGRGGQWKERVQKRHEEFVAWLEKNYPKEAGNLEKQKEKDPAQYVKQVAKKREKYGEIMEAETKNPKYAKVLKEDMKLKQTRDGLIRKIKNANADQKEELQAELRETVSKRFDMVIKKKEFKYKALKQRLEKLQKQVATRQAELDKLVQSKDKAIADRMKELVSQSEKLNWD